MVLLTKTNVALAGLVPNLVDAIGKWAPEALHSELKYRDSLLSFLRSNIPPDCRIEREYRHNGTTTDIFLSWKGIIFDDEVFIELKRDLNKKTVLDRLVGQIESLEPGKRSIVIVLVGQSDKSLVDRLKAKYAPFKDTQFDKPLAVVVM